MENSNQTNQTAEIRYTAPCRFDIGSVFYRIERANETVNFREPCKVCGGTHELTVNGTTFKRPCCSYEKEAITIRKYVVRRYRVYEIKDSVDTLEWKPSTRHIVKVKMYRKVGHGYTQWYSNGGYNGGNWEVRPDDIRFNVADIDPKRYRDFDGFVYSDYKLAVSVADKLSALELERLKAYNAEYGTLHEAVFKTTHDAKAN